MLGQRVDVMWDRQPGNHTFQL